jgi:adenylate cyclase
MTNAARDWLIDGASGAATSSEVFAGTCDRLAADGVPLFRAEAYVRTLHPQFAGRGFAWRRGEGVGVVEADHAGDLGNALASPIGWVFHTGKSARHRQGVGPPLASSPYLDDLFTAGAVELYAVPLAFTSGEVHAVMFATDRSIGFSETDIALIDGAIAPLSRMAEILALRRTAGNVLTAYVGRDAGARVLAGKIRRGDTELIEAALWFSDQRGFSTMSNQMSPQFVIDMLNELFDCQVPAIDRHGGEVLKFMGDGLLAIFPAAELGARGACHNALAAARDALVAVNARNASAPAEPPLRFGIALHFGEVAYGNIGSADRLDFTCIGRAVNLAARLEAVTGASGHDLLASAEFAHHHGGRFSPAGEYTVKGFDGAILAYVPADPG